MCKKTGYETKAITKQVRCGLQKRFGVIYRIYRCPDCNQYHLTTDKVKKSVERIHDEFLKARENSKTILVGKSSVMEVHTYNRYKIYYYPKENKTKITEGLV